MNHTSQELVASARAIIDDHKNPFDRAAQGKVENLLRMAELCRASEVGDGPKPFDRGLNQIFLRTQLERNLRGLDSATLDFFGGKQLMEPVISASGAKIERSQGMLTPGPGAGGVRSAGSVTVMRDFSSVMEARTYSGLAEGDGTGGVVPIGFVPAVLAAVKQTDQILQAANWDLVATADGRSFKQPSLVDTSTSAVKVAEAGAQTFANPIFGNIAWPIATTWSSQVVQVSLQLDVDAFKLAATIADAFRVRFARGFGADAVSTLLGDAATGATTAAAGAITQKDLLELVKSLDAGYAVAPKAGWCMNFATLLYIFENVVTSSTGGDALYHAQRDSQGHFLLLGFPVYISPSFPDLTTGSSKPVAFGDWNRFLIRNVPTETQVRRFDELFMANHQLGYELVMRADSAIMHAGGSGDDPIKVLQMHA